MNKCNMRNTYLTVINYINYVFHLRLTMCMVNYFINKIYVYTVKQSDLIATTVLTSMGLYADY